MNQIVQRLLLKAFIRLGNLSEMLEAASDPIDVHYLKERLNQAERNYDQIKAAVEESLKVMRAEIAAKEEQENK
jgi:hypothetical protein